MLPELLIRRLMHLGEESSAVRPEVLSRSLFRISQLSQKGLAAVKPVVQTHFLN